MTDTPRGTLWESLIAPARAATWLNVLYVLLAFPLGLLYFVFLIIGGSLGLGFALFTMANLVPRAFANRQWYIATFADYPRQRKSVIPFVF